MSRADGTAACSGCPRQRGSRVLSLARCRACVTGDLSLPLSVAAGYQPSGQCLVFPGRMRAVKPLGSSTPSVGTSYSVYPPRLTAEAFPSAAPGSTRRFFCQSRPVSPAPLRSPSSSPHRPGGSSPSSAQRRPRQPPARSIQRSSPASSGALSDPRVRGGPSPSPARSPARTSTTSAPPAAASGRRRMAGAPGTR